MALRGIVLAIFGAALLAVGLMATDGTSGPSDAVLLRSMQQRLDGHYNLRAAYPEDVPRVSHWEAIAERPRRGDRRVEHVVLARADLEVEKDILVWAIEYEGREEIDCSPIFHNPTCALHRTIIALRLINAMTGEGYGLLEISRIVGPSFPSLR